MSRAVLISINPPHTNNIFDRLKSIEWRTKPLPTRKYYCYETKKCFGVGKVIGEFRIWRVKRYENISLIPEGHIDSGCVPVEFLEAYSKGRPLYANFIIEPKRYDEPKELSEFKTVCTKFYNGEHCEECKYFIDGRGYEYDESDCGCDGLKPLERPPQSWCYVEEMRADR